MYTEHFHLREMPFAIEPDPRFLVLGEDHREALATLVYAIEQQEGWALLLGEAGVGKTTLIMALLRELEGRVLPAVLTNPLLEPLDFFNMVALELGLDGPFASKGQFLIALGQLITRCRQEGKVILLVVDEAHSLTPRLLEELRLMGNLDDSSPRVLNIFLVGQPRVLKLMKKAGAKGLMQRLHRHHLLRSLPQVETAEYVATRLEVAGGSKDTFQPDALEAVYQTTGGNPRLINILCDGAMLLAFSQGRERVSRAEVLQAAAEEPALDWDPDQELAAQPRPAAPARTEPAAADSAPPQPPEPQTEPAPEPVPAPAAPEPREDVQSLPEAAFEETVAAPPPARPEPPEEDEEIDLRDLIDANLETSPRRPPKRKAADKGGAHRSRRSRVREEMEEELTAEDPPRGKASRLAGSMSKDKPGSLLRRIIFLVIVLAALAVGYVLVSDSAMMTLKSYYWRMLGKSGPTLFMPEGSRPGQGPVKAATADKPDPTKDWGPVIIAPMAEAEKEAQRG